MGTTLAAVRTRVVCDEESGASPPVLWSGSRALPDTALLAGPGLRAGSVVHVAAPGPRAPAADAVLRLHVVCGPDAGLIVPLRRGRTTIGRSPDCDVHLDDADTSRYHAELTINVSDVWLHDLGSTNGTWALPAAGGAASLIGAEGQALPLEAYVRIGENVISVVAVDTPAAATSLGPDGHLLVNRPPRLAVRPAPSDIVYPDPERNPAAASLPWVAAALPALGGVALAEVMHNPQFLAFALLSPLLMLGTSIGERITGRRVRRRGRLDRRIQEQEADAAASTAARAETEFRRRRHPDPAAVAEIVRTPNARIWERRSTDEDFLDLRIGLGDVAADVDLRRGSHRLAPPILSAVPVLADLRLGPVGLCGPESIVRGVARWAVGQLAALHSPSDVSVFVLLDDDAHESWRWLRWLPHLSPPMRPGRVVARTDDARQGLVNQLLAVLDERAAVDRTRNGAWTGTWLVLLLDRASRFADTAGLSRLLTDGPPLGITAVCIDDEERRLPPACVSVASLSGETGTRVQLRSRSVSGAGDQYFVADRVDAEWAEALSRALAPLTDPGSEAAAALPRSVRLVELISGDDPEGVAPPAVDAIVGGWREGDGRPRATLGVSHEGVLTLDLARDGPHALVAGTTGAGKSELLQTLVLGLALSCAPPDLQLILIDYKGGAAFAECAALPHTAGLVTDLDAHLTERALLSLAAELRRREALFSAAGTSDVDSYRRSPSHRMLPVGRLVIVVDEFAALAEDLPDFVTGLVGIAQRGRSLGVHLVLATQRPAGVVSPEIRANTSLRVALRVTDGAESTDVLGSPEAASIDQDTPGRAYVRTGQMLAELQVARVGGRATRTDSIEVVPLGPWGELPDLASPPQVTAQTDLQMLVEQIRLAAQTVHEPTPPRPWLPPLPDTVDVNGLPPCGAYELPLGLVDRPGNQSQAPFAIDLATGGSLVIAGGPRSGRTSALRTAAAMAVHRLAPHQVHLYVIDCAGGALPRVAAAPHCGAAVGRDAPETVDRLLELLDDSLAERLARLAALGVGSLAEAMEMGELMPAQLLVLDGWEGFLACTEEVHLGRGVDTLLRLMREGAAAGLTVMVTGDRSALSARLSGAATRRLVLGLADRGDYALAGIPARAVPDIVPQGRAVDASELCELQLAVLGPNPEASAQGSQLDDIVEAARRLADPDAPGRSSNAGPAVHAGKNLTDPAGPIVVRPLPSRVFLSDLVRNRGGRQPALARGPENGTVQVLGAGGDAADAISVALVGTGTRMLIAGPPRSGRTTTLILIAKQLHAQGASLIICAHARTALGAIALAAGMCTLAPDSTIGDDSWTRALAVLTTPRPVLLADDTERMTDSAVGEALTYIVAHEAPNLSVVAAGRNDDLAVTFRGLAAEVKRSRQGLLLHPGAGDGDLLGVRLPSSRAGLSPGRGVLLADGSAMDGRGEPVRDLIPIQVCLP